nr:PQQ-dependent sugar dehydrogenase [Rhodoplanes roseus]
MRLAALCLLLGAVPALAQSAAAGAERRVDGRSGPLIVRTVTAGLVHPWGLAVLPDGRMLVTERPGRLRIVTRDGQMSAPLKGVPEVFAQDQGGLLDVALDPNFSANRLVYVSFAEPGPGGASTAVARGRLGADALEDVKVVFRQVPKVSGGNHFGSRLAFAPDGNLFITTGERFRFDPAQDLTGHLGKVIRIRPDGTVPDDNPFVKRPDARPEIWSYGHRNVQGAAIHPTTGVLLTHEMGPRGGDELNIPQAGRNYGWPLVSWGDHYDGKPIPKPPTRPDLADAIRHWTPVIAPSGMAFYTSDRIPGWRGSLLIGGLQSRGIVRLTLDGETVTGEERIGLGARIRDVVQGPDGEVLALTDEDDGKLLRLTPAE